MVDDRFRGFIDLVSLLLTYQDHSVREVVKQSADRLSISLGFALLNELLAHQPSYLVNKDDNQESQSQLSEEVCAHSRAILASEKEHARTGYYVQDYISEDTDHPSRSESRDELTH